MKRIAYLILAVSLAMSFSSFVYADGLQPFQLIGREISPGIDLGEKTVGALFVGEFFGGEGGQFTLILDHNGQNIEVCNKGTELKRFKLIMNFNTGGRLVLLGPIGADVSALWKWNDPECEMGNCPLIDGEDYAYYISLFKPEEPNPVACEEGGNAFIAEVPGFYVVKQRFGSYGTEFKGGSVIGRLVHTPIISPAIFGTVYLSE